MKNGPYTLVKCPEGYPGKWYRGRYCYEHHAVYWQHKGVIPGPGEVVHHKNEDKRDNRIDNLELKTTQEHLRDHNRKLPEIGNCPECGVEFQRYQSGPASHNPRKFCSRRCAGLMNQRKAKTCRGGAPNPNYSPDGTARV